jgi:AcrR family transcriptional regulator
VLKLDGFERRRERKKESIRHAALELFKINGIKKVSIAEIAKKAHVSPVTIYNHFGDKNTLACDVIKQSFVEKLNQYRDIMNSDEPFPNKIRMIMLDKTAMANDYDEELIEKYTFGSPELAVFINKVYEDDIKTIWVEILREGKEQGYIDKNMSIEAIFLYWNMLRKSADVYVDLYKNPKKNTRMIKELNNLIYYGLFQKALKLN